MRRFFARGTFAAALLACSGCSLLSSHPDTTRFAVLATVDELPGAKPPPTEATSALRVGLGPIVCPEYLRGAALVTRESATRLTPSANERWAEPFESALVRVLALDLQRELGTGRPQLHPWYESERPDVQVELAFSRCEQEAGGTVVVACRWLVRRLDAPHPVVERETRVERPLEGRTGDAAALALSSALAELCRTIAAAVRESAGGQ